MELLWLIPALPLAGFLLLTAGRTRFSRAASGLIGVGSIGLAMLFTLLVAFQFLTSPPAEKAYTQLLWQWLKVADFSPRIALYLDALSLVMILVVTVVGFLIHLYSARFMADDPGFGRYFAYMNLFVASMLILVLADNMFLLFLGWEGVGLCSYLLIGFWYKEPANNKAAVKAFVVTRVGDVAMALGLFLLFTSLGTLSIQDMLKAASLQWIPGSLVAVSAAALLLGGALGKSAQLPLQTWLPDAMAGPTPVSALIHAATMVTAGVYLIARTHVIFSLAPNIQFLVAVIGAVTLLLAGFSAITQRDIKRILAYSTISQIGYMFLALGVGAWPAAIFHFLTHAFFKSLLFLGAGVVIHYMNEEHDIFRMGGLWRKLPLTFWTFLVASLSMAAIPPLTAGFYSKDWILYWVWSSGGNSARLLWAAALLGVVLTATYTFRMVFITFFGPLQKAPSGRPGPMMTIPLIILAVPAALLGFLETPSTLGNVRIFSDFIHSVLPATITAHISFSTELILQILSEAASALGVILAFLIFLGHRRFSGLLTRLPLVPGLHRYWFSGWGFDWLYERLLVRPYVWAATANSTDFVDLVAQGIGGLHKLIYRLLSRTQSGKVRWYLTALAVGAVLILAMVVFL